MKIISIIITFCFLYQDIIYAQGAVVSAPLVKNLSAINIPSGLGRISEEYKGTNGKTIIHIIDTHADYNVQKNYVEILKQISGQGKKALLAIEGANGPIDTALFRAIPDEGIKKKITDYFLKKGYLTGAEYFSIFAENKDNFVFWGVDDKELYLKNLGLFKDVQGFRDRMTEYIKNVQDNIDTGILTKEQAEFIKAMKGYHNHKLSVTDYCKMFNTKEPNISNMLKAMDIDSKIDYTLIEKERTELMEELKGKLIKEDLEELIEKSLLFKAGRINSLEYYEYLLSVITSNSEVPMKSGLGIASALPRNDSLYANLYLYRDLLRLYSKISQKELIIEVSKLEQEVIESLFTTEPQKELARLQYRLILLQNLVDLELTREEWEYYVSHREDFTLPADGKEMKALEDYFTTVLQRDEALMQNTLNKMDEEKIDTAILITGGFHTEGITEKLKEKGVSYIVISPKGSGCDFDSPYLSVMLDKLSPFEVLITQYGTRLIQRIVSAAESFGEDVRKELLAKEVPLFTAILLIKSGQIDESKAVVQSGYEIDYNGITYTNGKINIPIIINGERLIFQLSDEKIDLTDELIKQSLDVIEEFNLVIKNASDKQLEELINRFTTGPVDKKTIKDRLILLSKALTVEALIDACENPQNRNNLRRCLMSKNLLPALTEFENAIKEFKQGDPIQAFIRRPVEFIEEIRQNAEKLHKGTVPGENKSSDRLTQEIGKYIYTFHIKKTTGIFNQLKLAQDLFDSFRKETVDKGIVIDSSIWLDFFRATVLNNNTTKALGEPLEKLSIILKDPDGSESDKIKNFDLISRTLIPFERLLFYFATAPIILSKKGKKHLVKSTSSQNITFEGGNRYNIGFGIWYEFDYGHYQEFESGKHKHKYIERFYQPKRFYEKQIMHGFLYSTAKPVVISLFGMDERDLEHGIALYCYMKKLQMFLINHPETKIIIVPFHQINSKGWGMRGIGNIKVGYQLVNTFRFYTFKIGGFKPGDFYIKGLQIKDGIGAVLERLSNLSDFSDEDVIEILKILKGRSLMRVLGIEEGVITNKFN